VLVVSLLTKTAYNAKTINVFRVDPSTTFRVTNVFNVLNRILIVSSALHPHIVQNVLQLNTLSRAVASPALFSMLIVTNAQPNSNARNASTTLSF